MKANHANLKESAAVNIQAQNLTYLSLQYCNMGSGAIWNIRGNVIKQSIYHKTHDGHEETYYVGQVYPEDMELYLEGNDINIHIYCDDKDDEDTNYYFRLGYVTDTSRKISQSYDGEAQNGADIYKASYSSGSYKRGSQLFTIDVGGAVYWKDKTSVLTSGELYCVRAWTDDDWRGQDGVDYYVYPFG